jgi:hypothetical protein
MDFMGQGLHFLGIEFIWEHHNDGHLTVRLTQQSFAEDLIEALGFASAYLLFLHLIIWAFLLILCYMRICLLLTEMH